MNKILVIEDERRVRFVIAEQLKNKGFEVLEAQDGSEGISMFLKERPAVVLLDNKMPVMDGFQTMHSLKNIDPSVPVIFVTGKGDISTAVEAIKKGAYDFLTKPLDFESFPSVVSRAIEKYKLEKEVSRLSSTIGASIEYMLGRSKAMGRVISQIMQVADSGFSVIIQGETGTGKSTVAELIHNLSSRRNSPYIKVDLSTIHENLLESELFGHEKGAFTGAEKARKGYFEIANGGTIFLDELQNVSPKIQSKILSAVEEKKIWPIGASSPVSLDVRIIGATNIEIKSLVAQKVFREDLFFRLSEFLISMPPLKERAEDIPVLALRFCHEACAELGKPAMAFSSSAIRLLSEYAWPGNIRELKNVIRRAALTASGQEIMEEDLDIVAGQRLESDQAEILPLKQASAIAVKDAETRCIKKALQALKGNKLKTAALLKVDYKTLLTKIKMYGLG